MMHPHLSLYIFCSSALIIARFLHVPHVILTLHFIPELSRTFYMNNHVKGCLRKAIYYQIVGCEVNNAEVRYSNGVRIRP